MCCSFAALFLPVAILIDSLNGYMKEQLECILGKELIDIGYPVRSKLGTDDKFRYPNHKTSTLPGYECGLIRHNVIRYVCCFIFINCRDVFVFCNSIRN
jgi:hypothetical protein